MQHVWCSSHHVCLLSWKIRVQALVGSLKQMLEKGTDWQLSCYLCFIFSWANWETNIAQLAMVITADFDLPFQGIRLRIFSKYNGHAMQAVSSKGRSFVNGKVLSNELRSLIVDKCPWCILFVCFDRWNTIPLALGKFDWFRSRQLSMLKTSL